MKDINDLKKAYLDFFNDRDHKIVTSSSLLPYRDPSLMFVNAGMVPFKNYFLGLEKPPYQNLVSSQKCLRAGGKHNDLDNVGYTSRHLTFFEMLGNFSFGGYFKQEAIEYAYKFVSRELALPRDRLLVTVHASDEESQSLWKKIAGFDESKIIRIDSDDNFWSMGSVGPCGPCTEIFYDHGEGIYGGIPGSAEEDGDRFVEIWNLVFMEFLRDEDGKLNALPKKCIDTGMGLERISAVLNGTHDVFATTYLASLIAEAGRLDENQRKKRSNISDSDLINYRIIADHVRSSSFLIVDGVYPANESKGYVLRRIMRRAMRRAYEISPEEPFMCKLVPKLVEEMGNQYTQLKDHQSLIYDTIRDEEIRFRKTLVDGLKILNKQSAQLGKGEKLSGKEAFKLHDTYGFPLDLTIDILRPNNIEVDSDHFNTLMKFQKEQARENREKSGVNQVLMTIEDQHFGQKEVDFLGYSLITADCQVDKLLKDNANVEILELNQEGIMVSSKTPFYAESGGQIGDTGRIIGKSGEAVVLDTQKNKAEIIYHNIKVIHGQINVGAKYSFEVDEKRRRSIQQNHSATHLLHAALKNNLGSQVTQRGSYVGPDRFRFDFNFNRALTIAEKTSIEQEVNNMVLQNLDVKTELMPLSDAIKSGAQALFGEKYSNEVRVVSMCNKTNEATNYFRDQNNAIYSRELCGGCHVSSTGEIGAIYFVNESSVGSGVRRLEVVSGRAAQYYCQKRFSILNRVEDLLLSKADKVLDRLSFIIAENKDLKRKIYDLQRQSALQAGTNENQKVNINGVDVVILEVEGLPVSELRSMVDKAKKDLVSGLIFVLGKSENNRLNVLIGVTQDIVGLISAVDIARKFGKFLGGKGGGGKPHLAQTGGTLDKPLSDILNQMYQSLKNMIPVKN